MTTVIPEYKMSEYRQAAQERQHSRNLIIEERYDKAWAMARMAAGILQEEFGASRVVVFGSLVNRSRFHLESDIDLGVWDIQEYFRAVARLLDIGDGFNFDLIPFEDAYPEIQEIILKEGKEV